MLVNALSYGTIIPLLYPFAAKFGIDPFGLSLLFASFSLAQFIATPIIGRLSDKYGRKPLLLLCLAGTGVSLALFASATNVAMLFIARILDGITGGNNSVAQAVIADVTTGEDRAKAFGILGASFGFGFLVGPALGGILSGYGLTVPFWFAAGLALIGTLLGVVLLKESLPPEKRGEKDEKLGKLFDLNSLVKALFIPTIGSVLLIGLLVTTALNVWIIGFQTTTVDVLKLSTQSVGLLFAAVGLINIIMQGFGIRVLLQFFHSKKNILSMSLLLSTIVLAVFFAAHSFWVFLLLTIAYSLFSSPQLVMLSGLISERTKAEDQGGILGINQAYTSLGQIIGPLAAGALTKVDLSLVYVLATVLMGMALALSRLLYLPVKEKLDL